MIEWFSNLKCNDLEKNGTESGCQKNTFPFAETDMWECWQRIPYYWAIINTDSLLRQEKEHKLKLLGPDVFRRGGGLARERVGAKKFGMSFEVQGNQTFCLDIPGFFRDIPGVPEKLEKKVCGQFSPPNHCISTNLHHRYRQPNAVIL